MSRENNVHPESSAPNGPRPAQTTPDPFDHAIAGLRRFIQLAEAKSAKAEELASVPDDVPRFVTEYRR